MGKTSKNHPSLLESPCMPIEEALPPSLSHSSLVCLSTPHSLKLRGQIGDRDVVVLIDFGASHNFLAAMLVEELGLLVAPTKEFGVLQDTGRKLKLWECVDM